MKSSRRVALGRRIVDVNCQFCLAIVPRTSGAKSNVDETACDDADHSELALSIVTATTSLPLCTTAPFASMRVTVHPSISSCTRRRTGCASPTCMTAMAPVPPMMTPSRRGGGSGGGGAAGSSRGGGSTAARKRGGTGLRPSDPVCRDAPPAAVAVPGSGPPREPAPDATCPRRNRRSALCSPRVLNAGCYLPHRIFGQAPRGRGPDGGAEGDVGDE
jgi:hypothetical protein